MSLLLLLLLTFFSCATGGGDAADQKNAHEPLGYGHCKQETFSKVIPLDYHFSYHLEAPDQTFLMQPNLQEISGISITANSKYLLAVQDEAGILYVIDKITGKVKEEVAFGKEGDYEGVESVGNDVYLLRSSGSMKLIRNLDQGNQETIAIKSPLDKSYDVEGIAFDSKNNRLLLACKGSGSSNPLHDNQRGIYAFDLSLNQLDTLPIFCITQASIQGFLKENPSIEKIDKLQELFNQPKMDFGPSGLAIEPQTGNLFVLSARGNTLLVFSPAGQILHLERLKNKVHAQPEGICFDVNGNLYISNEGKEGIPGTIYCFNKK